MPVRGAPWYTFPAWGRGGIGIRRRLKIFGLRDCGFESHRPYQRDIGPGDGAVVVLGALRGLEPERARS